MTPIIYQDEKGNYHQFYKQLIPISVEYKDDKIMCFTSGKFEFKSYVRQNWKRVNNHPGKQLSLF